MTSLPNIQHLRRSSRRTTILQRSDERCSQKMEVHLPHKKILAKLDLTHELPDPLTGFKESQEKRIRKDSLKSKFLTSITPFAAKTSVRLSVRPTKYFEDDGSSSRRIRISSRESGMLNSLRQEPVVADLIGEIDKMKKARSYTFIYLSYAVSKDSIYFTPYCLVVVPYQELNIHNYLTMSPHGVTRYTNEQVFTKLNLWEYKYKMFCSLKEIKFFKLFRMWKAFYLWRKTMVYKKYTRSRKKLQNNLFTLNFVFGRCLLTLYQRCWIMFHENFAELTLHEDTPLYYFIENQMERLERVRNELDIFNKVVMNKLVKTCYAALKLEGFDINIEVDSSTMNYMDKAKRRDFCARITNFIKLIDLITIHMLHCLVKRSYSDMVDLLKMHSDSIPPYELLSDMELETILEEVPRERDVARWPMIQIELGISDDFTPILNPSEDMTLDIFTKILNLWNTITYSMTRFQLEDSFSRYYQQSGLENISVRNILSLQGFILNQDTHMLAERDFLMGVFLTAYSAISTYLGRFKSRWLLYKEDVETDVNVIKSERELSALKALCVRYRDEIKINESITMYQTLGMFFICLIPMKTKIIAKPRELFNVLAKETPSIGREMVKSIIDDCDKQNTILNTEPETSTEIIEYNLMLNGIEQVVTKLEERLEYIRELYDMMGEYGMTIPSDDMVEYLGLGQVLGGLRLNCDRVLESRDRLVKMFNSQINTDIDKLLNELVIVRERALQPWLLDINSDPQEVIAELESMADEMVTHQETYKQIQDWQRMFKLHVTRLEAVAEVIQEVQLRHLLWTSFQEWGGLREHWFKCDFNSLNLEEVQSTTVNYGKIVNKIEKNLPRNKLIPQLRDSVEDMKQKLTTITFLKNPALKPRHWMEIESILNTRFTVDTVLTLELLESLKVFDHIDELTEVSGQASSEESLEVLLKKIEGIWKVLELPVLPYRDNKDIFMLGSLEDVQTAIDETCMLIGIILSSRNCGPIKGRVEEWERIMDQFSKTLNEWFLCMQTWMYLEVLFSAPDIQRQLPNEARLFTMVDKSWKDVMRKTAKVPLALAAATDDKLLDIFTNNNSMLDQIMKCLEAYLETKRVAFPRFYFLSNDELLEILAQTRNPHAVQPHLRKCFDAIAKLEFAMKPKERRESMEGVEDEHRESEGELEMTTDIAAMISPENERISLGKGLKARGNVEDWLGKVEEAMFASLKKCMKLSLSDFMIRPRTDWMTRHPNQVVLTVSQIMWAKRVHQILEMKSGSGIAAKLVDFEKENISDLNDSAALTRTNISKLFRKVLCALITIDVHARDTITNMIEKEVRRPDAFDWLKMIRYYWEVDIDNCVARMSSASYIYGHEYIGVGGVLVITPLTDRCYLCLMGALQLDLGGAPAGPAGTGKTETTKDLAKSLAIQCVVFNCSEGLDYKMMGRFFSGLVSSGAWCCFDEFNRINIEVLSVIAQQLITIRNAKVAKQKRFVFEGREIKLIATCAVFITMNPGYAGRTELPDNLKALFRPISMMVPDYGLIAEVILYSEGFESSRNLAKKMVQMYKLCSEQLSQQDHYDFGMRAVKSVLVMAGALKRASPDQHEEVTLMCALRDSNLPKFLADDAVLFAGILGDLFPGVQLPEKDYAVMEEVISRMLLQNKLQVEHSQIAKVIQLHETMIVRWGVMLVGPTGGGKTTILTNLGETLTELHNLGIEDPYFQIVHKYVMNPKALTMGELYGEVNPLTLEWNDGLLAISLRTAVQCTEEDHQWIICDGPVDAVWIENMNTVLDDNKMLCLANSERIKLTPYVHMVFEVENLAQASPATVSRCGMVYVDPSEMEWQPYVRTWLETLPDNKVINAENKDKLYHLFHYIDQGFYFIRKNCLSGILQVDISKVGMLCNVLQSLLLEPVDNFADKEEMHNYIVQCFLFSYIWAIGGNLLDDSRVLFEHFVKQQFAEVLIDVPLPLNLWDVYIDHRLKIFDVWNKMVPQYIYNMYEPFFEILVPTKDTVRYGYIMQRLFKQNRAVMFTGNTGVGKSVIAKTVLNTLGATGLFVPFTMNFSAQTSSSRTQEIFESHLERRKRTIYGAPYGKKIILFIDDVNMPKLDVYGSQPTIELLRQFLDFGGLYDREKMFWKEIRDVVLSTACAPPGGGRNPLTPRFTRHFAMLFITTPNDETLKVIFRSILTGYLEEFVPEVSVLAVSIVNAAVDTYGRVISKLLPTPAKSHYVFNLRDLSKCMQGVLQADAGLVKEGITILKLFYHECLRVFHDRLISVEDRSFFYHLMYDVCMTNFGQPIIEIEQSAILTKPPLLLFGDFMNYGAAKENRIYEEIKDLDQLKYILQFYLDEYNSTARAEMKLVLFTDAAEHVVRIARVLRAERGHALLVGPGGSGRRSLATLAAYINEYKCFGMELTKSYDITSFHDDLRSLCINTGVRNEDTVFLFTDTQILQEEFLEDINNILNSGEVPNLFEGEDYEKVILACRGPAAEAGVNANDRESVFTYFVNKIRAKLHLCICMSPVGDVFRRRCRMFPSLVNCCTIDWFVKWPPEALLTVATKVLGATESPEMVPMLAEICVLMHESVEVMTERLYVELHRYFYTTPSSYLDLFKLYSDMLDKKRQEILKSRARIANGLTKLYETYEVVGVMEQQVKSMEPALQKKSVEAQEMMAKMKLEEEQADKVKIAVMQDEASAKIQAAETQELADDAARDLKLAMPAMEAAQNALKSLNKADINELRVFQKPPALVKFVMEPVCLLLGAKTDWDSAKKVMGDGNFLKNLEEYDKDHIKDAMLKKIKVYIDHKDFEPDIVVKVSKVCRSMCLWVRAVDTYAKVFRVVEPKILKQKEAEQQMAAVMSVLREKQSQLAQVEAMLAAMKDTLQKMEEDRAVLQGTLDLAEARLNRAGKLTQALADEQARWEESVKNLTSELECTTGNIIVGSGCVAYFGAFPTDYRQELVSKWIAKCNELNILISQNFSMTTVLTDAYTVRMWNTSGLPRDNVSVENGILVTKAGRWPLMIDPQEQANRWVRNMEKDNQLQIVKLTDGNYMRIMENCIRLGRPILIEEIAETLDPTLSPILQKCTYIQSGRLLIHLGDTDIEYDPNFKLYITTKLANPHYLPDICIQVTIVNFTVTLLGLEDQLLAEVVRIERPDLEAQRSELIIRINNDKMQLLAIEDKILRMLFASSGNILDDEELIETLNESKETSAIVVARLLDSEATEKNISIAREKYRPIATRGAVLYFAVSTLSTIDPMYQFSLKYFQLVFTNVLETTEKEKDFEQHIKKMLNAITLSIYTNISRGLFEKHKLVYSFLLNMAVFRQANMIPENYWLFFLRGPVGSKVVPEKKPLTPGLTDAMWLSAQHLDETFPSFKGIKDNCLRNITISIGGYVQDIKIIRDSNIKSSINWDNCLNNFEKLILLKALKTEALVGAITEYVSVNLGRAFIESSVVTLNSLYMDMSNITPLVFILSSGSDPFGAFQKFATEQGYIDRVKSISLGQGQGPIAEKMIALASLKGDWVFLQNCHLAASWMLSLEQIVQKLSTDDVPPHSAFRLFLSSMPSDEFPVSVLQNSVKVTNEAPKGLRANIKRAFQEMNEEWFEGHPLGQDWRTMVFGLCTFHAVIQERKKFGPLGWTIIYEFSDSDRDCALSNLEIFCRNSMVLWDALQYITGEITYGGRVTDIWDQRCLKTILLYFFAPHVLKPGYVYSESGVYYCPRYEKKKDFQNFIEQLPIIEEPEVFGMHDNANIAFQMEEINQFITNIMKGQTVGAGDKGGESPDQIVWKLSEEMKVDIALQIDVELMLEKHMVKDSMGRVYSLTTVLIQEINRFNKLLKFIHISLVDIQKALKGFIVMSDDLEDVFVSFLNNQVPKIWTAKAYNSLKSLGSWVHDLILRINFVDHWMQFGAPPSSWISGLFFPQGLLTGTLQAFSRRYGVSINQLMFDFTPLPLYINQDDVRTAYISPSKNREKTEAAVFQELEIPENGIYIHGLFIDAGRWDIPSMQLVDSNLGERSSDLPVFWLRPVDSMPSPDPRYVAPLYKTAARAGVLSTTGHSTNFVIPFLLAASQPQAYWILRGTALITQKTD